MSSLLLTRRSSLRVATTVPTTLARIILSRRASPLGLPCVVARLPLGRLASLRWLVQPAGSLVSCRRSPRARSSFRRGSFPDRERVFQVGVRTRDDVDRDELAHAPRGGRA